MFDVAPTELLLCAVVALVVIGPKDLPKAMRVLGYWVGRARGVARQFRSGIDSMIREAELAEMEKKWAEENERIMREHPTATDGSWPPEATNDAPTVVSDSAPMLPLPEPTPTAPPPAAGEHEGER
ncbi:Sec-independent protein translocase protein TatB [Sphingomonas tabacisoli]|uniref:Sec-independent protein translocase protein TatB n=1 Tax=Sphingomonas tabacisoli TaxID=2249466 RepID=A0ABW4I3M8_9SPHN